MARPKAQKKSKKPKSRSAARPAKKAKRKATAKAPSRKRVSKAKATPKKTKPKSAQKARKKALSSPRRPAKKGKKDMQTVSRKPAPKAAASVPETPPRLLRQTKTTAAALALLEKGIGHIHKRDFKKARSELKTLLETYPGEMEILARARSYIQICNREEATQKKPPATTDQLYTLGILEHNKSNYEAAISYFLKSLETHPEADYIYYSVAASQAMNGNLTESMVNLRKAVELNEDSKIFAKNDDDFSALQTQQDFIELVGFGLPPDTESGS